MDDRLQEMLDHYEIRKTVSEYCHGLDRMDELRMASIYAADSFDDHGSNRCPGPQFAKQVLEFMRSGASCADHHMLGQTLAVVDGDCAGAETYFTASMRRIEPEGGEVLLQIGGRYVDRLVREDERWKVWRRAMVRDWSITHPIVDDWAKDHGFIEGQRSEDDPSFAVLGLRHSGVPARS